jgi:hypothetical protein
MRAWKVKKKKWACLMPFSRTCHRMGGHRATNNHAAKKPQHVHRRHSLPAHI